MTRIVIVLAAFLWLAAPGRIFAQEIVIPDPSPFAELFAVESLTIRPAQGASLDPSALQAPAETPPKRQHTGLGALVRATASDFKAFPMRKATYLILAVGGAAAGIARPIDGEVNEHLKDSDVRKFFQPGRVIGYAWVQAGAAAGIYLIGRYAVKPAEGESNKISHIGFDLLRANILTQALTYGVKYAVRRDRPTGECCSFPSGHASVAFATASVLERHFGYRAAWPTFAIGGYVAASRIFDNRHFLSDVLFGSALGMAAGWTVVGRHGRDDYALMPVPMRGGAAVVFMWTPAARPAAVK